MTLSWKQQKEQNKIDAEKHRIGRPLQASELTGRKAKTARKERKLVKKLARRQAKRATA